jgi:hypothetical protein
MPRKPPKKLVLNDKRAKLIKEVQKQVKRGQTPNISRAGRAAGYGTPQAALYSFSQIKLHLPRMLEEAGLGTATILKGFKESEQATETEFWAHNGVVIDEREVVANDIRLRARVEVAKMLRLYPTNSDSNPNNAPPSGPSFTLVVNDSRVAERMLEQLAHKQGGGEQPRMDEALDVHEG